MCDVVYACEKLRSNYNMLKKRSKEQKTNSIQFNVSLSSLSLLCCGVYLACEIENWRGLALTTTSMTTTTTKNKQKTYPQSGQNNI